MGFCCCLRLGNLKVFPVVLSELCEIDDVTNDCKRSSIEKEQVERLEGFVVVYVFDNAVRGVFMVVIIFSNLDRLVEVMF